MKIFFPWASREFGFGIHFYRTGRWLEGHIFLLPMVPLIFRWDCEYNSGFRFKKTWIAYLCTWFAGAYYDHRDWAYFTSENASEHLRWVLKAYGLADDKNFINDNDIPF